MPQTADSVLMIRPARFGSNPETAASNAFQHPGAVPQHAAHAAALREFDRVVDALLDTGVNVCVVDDEPEPRRPDAVFPNNWLSTHEDGTVVLYPMQAPSRRAEVRRDAVDALQQRHGFRVDRIVDLTPWATRGLFLEGTGSMVLDRIDRVAYACRSPRTDREVLHAFCTTMGFEPFEFVAADAAGVAVYHTNVQMWIGTQTAAVCLDAVAGHAVREALSARLAAGGRTVLDLTREQMASFAGNALELRSAAGHPVIAMSAQAVAALTHDQRSAIEAYAKLAVADIGTIETCSGGSVRCMLAEIFLPRGVGRMSTFH